MNHDAPDFIPDSVSEASSESPAEGASPLPNNTPAPKIPLHRTGDNSRRVRLTRAIMRVLGDLCIMKTTCKVTLSGLEHVPQRGATIILYNHMTYLDPVLACAPIRFRDNVPIGKKELSTNPFIGWISWMWSTIPLKRGELDMSALRRCLYVLQETSDVLSIAPEGHRYKALGAPKEGFIMLAARTNAVMVPVGLSGQQHFRRNMLRLRRTPVTVSYGRPVRLGGKVGRGDDAAAAVEIMYQIAAQLPPELRGAYGNLDQATMRFIAYAD
ncbi:MAG TPA: lysophospholipid acyltransferase family protein [Aggregatilineales bacterium]|nr:lysophospholipid acyltransferase family protein [Aggregatilineales bacterium]